MCCHATVSLCKRMRGAVSSAEMAVPVPNRCLDTADARETANLSFWSSVEEKHPCARVITLNRIRITLSFTTDSLTTKECAASACNNNRRLCSCSKRARTGSTASRTVSPRRESVVAPDNCAVRPSRTLCRNWVQEARAEGVTVVEEVGIGSAPVATGAEKDAVCSDMTWRVRKVETSLREVRGAVLSPSRRPRGSRWPGRVARSMLGARSSERRDRRCLATRTPSCY